MGLPDFAAKELLKFGVDTPGGRVLMSAAERAAEEVLEFLGLSKFAPASVGGQTVEHLPQAASRSVDQAASSGSLPDRLPVTPAEAREHPYLSGYAGDIHGTRPLSVPTDHRKFATMQRELKIPRMELDSEGRLVLDIGAGHQNMAREAEALGLRSRIVSLEPQVAPGLAHFHPLETELLRPHRLSVAGYAQILPFRDKVFDSAYMSWSFHLLPDDQIAPLLSEVHRVLKSRGIARIYPIGKEEPVRSWLSSLGLPETDYAIKAHDLFTFTAR